MLKAPVGRTGRPDVTVVLSVLVVLISCELGLAEVLFSRSGTTDSLSGGRGRSSGDGFLGDGGSLRDSALVNLFQDQ